MYLRTLEKRAKNEMEKRRNRREIKAKKRDMKQSPSATAAAAANHIWSVCALKHQTMMYLCNTDNVK